MYAVGWRNACDTSCEKLAFRTQCSTTSPPIFGFVHGVFNQQCAYCTKANGKPPAMPRDLGIRRLIESETFVINSALCFLAVNSTAGCRPKPGDFRISMHYKLLSAQLSAKLWVFFQPLSAIVVKGAAGSRLQKRLTTKVRKLIVRSWTGRPLCNMCVLQCCMRGLAATIHVEVIAIPGLCGGRGI